MSNVRILALFAAAASLAAGCSGKYSGVGYVNLGVRVTRADASLAIAPECFTLPVLVGGRAEKIVAVDDSLSIRLLMSDEDAEVSFEGAAGDAAGVTIAAESLRSSKSFAQDVPVQSASGGAYTASFSAGCDADAD